MVLWDNDLHELPEVKLGGLQDLHLADVHVLEGEDAWGGLLNLLSNNLRDELWYKLHNSQTFILTEMQNKQDKQIYLSDLAGLGVASALHLVRASLGKANAEHAEHVVVFTSTWASMSVCHFLTSDLSLSVVKSMPWQGGINWLAMQKTQHNIR